MLLSILYPFIFLLSHRAWDSPIADCTPPPFPQFVPRQTYQASIKDKQNSITQMALWDFLQLTSGKNSGHDYSTILHIVNVKSCAVCIGNHLHLSVTRGAAVTTASLERFAWWGWKSSEIWIVILFWKGTRSAFLQYIQATNVTQTGWSL